MSQKKEPRILEQFQLDGGTVDSLDLKMFLITPGIVYLEEIYKRFSRTGRIAPCGSRKLVLIGGQGLT